MSVDSSVRDSRLPSPRDLLKHSVRGLGVATSSLRSPPDFLVIGAKRGGTTSFYYDLLDHPSVLPLFPPPIPRLKTEATKGAHFFDSNFTRGPRWYASYFPTRTTRYVAARRAASTVVTGEASPYYLFHPAAAERAYALVPGAKIIVLLRDPVERTYSHWKERRRSRAEDLQFREALGAEPGRLVGERERLLRDPAYHSNAWEQQSYATQSVYVDALEPWVRLFGRRRVLALASEDYYTDPAAALGTAHDFLDIPGWPSTPGTVRNAAAGEPLPPDLLAQLRARFAEPNRRLEQLLGMTFPWS
ncbi:MAG: sulfotransferase domain-containing protein [Actinomycetota bacterium]|nr:sulfotransferase domain-containing protein [Actinomycetota bacterium]